MLTSFSIQRFRGFEALELPRLGRVNLVVGKNNIGKTMLLEALRLHRAKGSPVALLGMLGVHDEFLREPAEGRAFASVDVAALFHGWDLAQPVSMGPVDRPEERLTLALQRATGDEGSSKRRGYGDRSHHHELRIAYGGEPVGWIHLDESLGFQRASVTLSGPEYQSVVHRSGHYAHIGSPFLGPRSVTDQTLARWWDATSLTDAEQRVIESLRIVSPVERINMVAHPLGQRPRMVQVLLEGESRPLPLRHLGDGIVRIFALALALENAREAGLLLIDEIENGIHYSGLGRLWHFVFEAAAHHGVQVFATTHSWDCVQAFQEATERHRATDGTLVKLLEEDGSVEGVVLREEDLAIVTRDRIEVR
ncbi:MAG: AAA family ATPase [Myxococcota bacterium]